MNSSALRELQSCDRSNATHILLGLSLELRQCCFDFSSEVFELTSDGCSHVDDGEWSEVLLASGSVLTQLMSAS